MIRKAIRKLFVKILVRFRKNEPVIKSKIEYTINQYNDLIKEFELIQQHKSGLSVSQRKQVKNEIEFLISKGHIKVENKNN